jgi:hypothetical protein
MRMKTAKRLNEDQSDHQMKQLVIDENEMTYQSTTNDDMSKTRYATQTHANTHTRFSKEFMYVIQISERKTPRKERIGDMTENEQYC